MAEYPRSVERWGVFEIILAAKPVSNPYADLKISAEFVGERETVAVEGFFDGENMRVRFMPSFEDEYRFALSGDLADGEAREGAFIATAPSAGNHGPVHPRGFHFAYADGTPYYPIGTTSYVWAHQPLERQTETLETLRSSAFNKIRFCVFPKHYQFNLHDPIMFPYEGTPMDCSGLNDENFIRYSTMSAMFGGEPDWSGNDWDFRRFNPDWFALLDKHIAELDELGIEADIILFHPYDRWGFSAMGRENDLFYLRYMINRYAACKNVWWSMANEYDLIPSKSIENWEEYGEFVRENDPYDHPRSIHNCRPFYDHTRPWITHASVQRVDVYKTGELAAEWREKWQKPVVIDEIAYEGNINHGWGNLTAEELVRRSWEAIVRGGYPSHSETMLYPDGETEPQDRLFWSHGGKLYGRSAPRFAFMRRILEELPNGGALRPAPRMWDEAGAALEADAEGKDFYLAYYGFFRPSFREFYFDDESEYKVELIDTWNMTVERLNGAFRGRFRVDFPLPAKQYMAVRITKI